MALEYVKHNRTISTDHMQKYGRLATHDIHVPVLLAYELGRISDKNGTPVNLNEQFIRDTLEKTNKYITKKSKSPFAKLFSWWSKPIDEVESIPIIKNHKTDDIDGKIGHIQGLLYTENHDGILSLWGKAIISDPEAKLKVEGGIFRNTSFGTRPDGSIKELSFVINEAIPHGGIAMSEENTQQSQEHQFAEEIAGLQFEEQQLTNIIIPNHLRLSKLIKTGRIQPWMYDKLINDSNASSVLELAEQSIPAINLGIMYGTRRHPEKAGSDDDKLINSIVAKYKRTKTKTEKTADGKKIPQHKPEQDTFINQPFNFEEVRQNELKHILELAEHSPEIAAKYIKIELGENEEQQECTDIYLAEYLTKVKELKTKITQLQLGETNG